MISPCFYERYNVFSGTAKERAKILMDAYQDPDIVGIFDLSGGDLANEILDFLDYEAIAKARKPFWGYSDLTCLLNAIYARTVACQEDCGKPKIWQGPLEPARQKPLHPVCL